MRPISTMCAVPLALLFLAVFPSDAQVSVTEAATATATDSTMSAMGAMAEEVTEFEYEVSRPFTLACPLTEVPVAWSKNGTALEKVAELVGRWSVSAGGAKLTVGGRSTEDDWGDYECAAGGRAQRFFVRGRTHARLPSDTNVVEGQRMRVTCRLVGKPYGEVAWTYDNGTDAVAPVAVERAPTLAGRVSLAANEQGVANAELTLEGARREDAGRYSCAVLGAEPPANATTTLRVKDMYAALWPFLGICAEVLLLCAIILLYEKRRTKPELDDSDADHHDQKKS